MKFYKKPQQLIYKAILNTILKIGLITLITIFIFEVAYRYSVIDFYNPELKELNTEAEIKSEDIDCLVFGDSFSAWENNYVSFLKKQYPNKTFVNSGISGIGLKELNTFAKRRIKSYTPKKIVYQVYVGNDLVDVKRLSNWKDLSLMRSIYWKTTDYLTSPIYINKRLASVGKQVGKINVNFSETFSVESETFSVETYSQREKIMIKANPNYLDYSISLKFENRYNIWKIKLQKFLEIIPESTKVYIVFIPHALQVNDFYYNNMLALNATFSNKKEVQKIDYDFFTTAKKDFKHFNNVKFLNPLNDFKFLDTPKNRMYYEIDPHLTTLGQKTLANYLSQYIF